MKPLTIAKLVLAAAGVVVFALGVRADASALRWTGTGLVAAAWLMRFVKDKPGDPPPAS
ncbi:MAG: hypothetical protein HYR75_07665 [Gemmatimonadetes bacterium]|nr:hypothetical protein [Gemmatimonadota bacterium]MBI3569006.1 hypothetical protein [Gemmatimonadota bacterium]